MYIQVLLSLRSEQELRRKGEAAETRIVLSHRSYLISSACSSIG